MKETLTPRQSEQVEAVTVFLANRECSIECSLQNQVLYRGSHECKPIARKYPRKDFDLYIANLGAYKEIMSTSN